MSAGRHNGPELGVNLNAYNFIYRARRDGLVSNRGSLSPPHLVIPARRLIRLTNFETCWILRLAGIRAA